MDQDVLLPIVTGVGGGVGTWLITQVAPRLWARRPNGLDCSHLSGVWHSIHLTRRDKLGYSRHRYELSVTRAGNVKGKLIELATKPETKYSLRGRIGPGGWVLHATSLTRTDEYAIEVYPDDFDEDRMVGFLISFDLKHRPFCSLVVFSRGEITTGQYAEAFEQHRDRFYLFPEVGVVDDARPG